MAVWSLIFFKTSGMNNLKKCTSCEKHLDLSMFYKDNRREGGTKAKCKKCEYIKYTHKGNVPLLGIVKDLPEEIWMDIMGYEGLYQLSNMGRVKSLNYKKRTGSHGILKQNHQDCGYLYVEIYDSNHIFKFIRVHILVAKHFIPNPENKPDVNHKKCNKKDNRASELEWCTKKENSIHAVKTGLLISQKGSKHGGSKLKESDIIEIREKADLFSRKELGVMYGVGGGVISNIVNRKRWKHVP